MSSKEDSFHCGRYKKFSVFHQSLIIEVLDEYHLDGEPINESIQKLPRNLNSPVTNTLSRYFAEARTKISRKNTRAFESLPSQRGKRRMKTKDRLVNTNNDEKKYHQKSKTLTS